MSRDNQLQLAITYLGDKIGLAEVKIGDPAQLPTLYKDSLGASLTEMHTALANATDIDDATASGEATFSSAKIQALITQAKSDILGGAPASLDTLQEVATALQANDNAEAVILEALAKRVRVDAAQSFTEDEKGQARGNIGAASHTAVTALSTTLNTVQATADAAQAKGAANEAALNNLVSAVGDTTTDYRQIAENARNAALATAG